MEKSFKSLDKIEFKQVLVTPSIANDLLSTNSSNRLPHKPTVARYAQDMVSGRWKSGTAEPIKISITGRLIDGQHRLLAIVASKLSIVMWVASGLEDDVFDVLDTGKIRNSTDIFKIQGIAQDNTIPSIISMHNLLVNGRRYGAAKNNKSTNAMLLEQYYKNEAYWQNIARKARSWYMAFAKILPPSYFGGFYAYFFGLNEEKANEFMAQLATGLNVTHDSVTLLRNKLIQDKTSSRKMPPNLKMAFIIKAWNAFVTDKEIRILKFEPMREEFPQAVAS
jgi:hypothetical protein